MKKVTTEEFIERARAVHGEKYDYSKVEYVNYNTKVCIICPIHGEFWQTPHCHLNGSGCPKCSNVHHYNTEEWIEAAKRIHGDKYDYSKVKYVDSHTKVCIICPKHGEFWQMPYLHVNLRNGCPKCVFNCKDTNESFINKAKKVHGNYYDYSKIVYVNAYTEVCIICPKHGEFWQKPHNHLNGQGCSKCKISKLERRVKRMLEIHNINFDEHKRFEWLRSDKTNGRLSLDFYLPDYNIAIECQGGQHFFAADFGNHNAEHIQKELFNIKRRDFEKLKKCKENGIKLYHYFDDKKYFGTYENEAHSIEELKKILLC